MIKNTLNHPIFISIGILTSVLSIIAFFIGKQYLKECFTDNIIVPISKSILIQQSSITTRGNI